MCLGALAAILILICNINTILLTKLKTSYSPSYLYLSMSADILYIFSVISQGWGFKVWLHSFPWILSRSLMVISYVLVSFLNSWYL
ncbi:hypothetical protein SNE40_015653 [Patella caerulea]|uniref:Uncharacterized protein n=1 Tax=Patella caerulea TaxID=87958 RepID=A0AAN8JL56_PATCE